MWLGFERLTQVPIQLRMVKMEMLTKEEKAWLKVRSHLLLVLFLVTYQVFFVYKGSQRHVPRETSTTDI